MSDWYYVLEGKQEGPITEEGLQKKIDDRSLSDDVTVWKEGMTDWVKISERHSIESATADEPKEEIVKKPLPGLSKLQIMSILACVVCLCNPFAPFAFVFSLQAKNAHEDGRDEDAQRKLSLCKKMLAIAFILSALIYLAVVGYFTGMIPIV